jgi:hypothetical protein
MLREVPSFVEHEITIEAPAMHEDQPDHSNDLFDDIFGSAPNSPTLGGSQDYERAADRGNTNEVSDIPA